MSSETLNSAVAQQASAVTPEAGWIHPAQGVNRVVDADAGDVELLMPDGVTRRRKIALVGFAASTRAMAPVDDPEWAVCGMNQLYRHLTSAQFEGKVRTPDVWFEMHREWNTAVVPGTDHEGWLRDCGIPIFMTERVPGLPTSVRYPIERLIDKFSDYYTSTVAYMVAWATDYIDREVANRMRETPTNGMASVFDVAELQRSLYAEYTIGIYGIDLIVGEEYDWQKACAEYFIGQVLARNITLLIPQQSALLHQRYRYGYHAEPVDLVKDSDLAKRRAFLTQEHQKHSEVLVQIVGGLKELDWIHELRRLRERGGNIEI